MISKSLQEKLPLQSQYKEDLMEQTFLRTFWISKFSLQNLKRRMGNGYFSLLEKQCEALVQHRDNFSEFFKGASSQITKKNLHIHIFSVRIFNIFIAFIHRISSITFRIISITFRIISQWFHHPHLMVSPTFKT